MASPFSRTVRAAQGDESGVFVVWFGVMVLFSGLWLTWFFWARVALVESSQPMRVSVAQLRQERALTAQFPQSAAEHMRLGQRARLRLAGPSDFQTRVLPVVVTKFDNDSGIGPVQATFSLLNEPFTFADYAGALTGQIDVDVQTVSPARWLMHRVEPTSIPVVGYRVVREYPHDPNAFTQGLAYAAGVLYEGTGLQGRSSVRKVDLATGQVQQMTALPTPYFGEGITIFGDSVVQLTWRSHVGFVYDKESLTLQRDFAYPTEGWGITHDGERLIVSDGTDTLYFWDANTFAEIGRVQVTAMGQPVSNLNELEYVNGLVYANIWQTDRIALIDPVTGQVTAWLDLTGLLTPTEQSQPADVLNGIAYDAVNQRLFVTGKLWPKLFEIDIQ
ncbi:MAG: glutaminyl-peptide cyclotransferase [Chloroflexota bacterium]